MTNSIAMRSSPSSSHLSRVIRLSKSRQSSIDMPEKPSNECGIVHSPQLLEQVKSAQRLRFCFSKHILRTPQPGLQL